MPDSDTDNVNSVAAPVRERFVRTLKEAAQSIKSVRNDVYTVKYWQLAVNFVLGVTAIVNMILAMTLDAPTSTVCLIVGIALAVGVVVFNAVLKTVAPMSFLQYTAIVDGNRYCFQILSKNRALFCNGHKAVEVDRFEFSETHGVRFPQYRFDFFADMDPSVRIGKADCEIYKGTVDAGGRRVKCKVVFKQGRVFSGTVGGARIKYFDINDTKEKFVVPDTLRTAAERFDVPFPKLAGVTVKDMHINMTNQ